MKSASSFTFHPKMFSWDKIWKKPSARLDFQLSSTHLHRISLPEKAHFLSHYHSITPIPFSIFQTVPFVEKILHMWGCLIYWGSFQPKLLFLTSLLSLFSSVQILLTPPQTFSYNILPFSSLSTIPVPATFPAICINDCGCSFNIFFTPLAITSLKKTLKSAKTQTRTSITH